MKKGTARPELSLSRGCGLEESPNVLDAQALLGRLIWDIGLYSKPVEGNQAEVPVLGLERAPTSRPIFLLWALCMHPKQHASTWILLGHFWDTTVDDTSPASRTTIVPTVVVHFRIEGHAGFQSSAVVCTLRSKSGPYLWSPQLAL